MIVRNLSSALLYKAELTLLFYHHLYLDPASCPHSPTTFQSLYGLSAHLSNAIFQLLSGLWRRVVGVGIVIDRPFLPWGYLVQLLSPAKLGALSRMCLVISPSLNLSPPLVLGVGVSILFLMVLVLSRTTIQLVGIGNAE